MSQRGLVLALQRFHDDPGFKERVAQDPQSTLGIYDLEDDERQQLMNMDDAEMHELAASVGLNWGPGPTGGVGALDDDDESTGGPRKTHISVSRDQPTESVPHALPGDGYEGVRPG
ncbi:MAG: hypothetical protein ACJ78Q_04395 [Chloroflexia bacterium]